MSAPLPPRIHVGLDGVPAATSHLGFVDGQRGVLCIAGQSVQALAGTVPWSTVAWRLLRLGAGKTPVPLADWHGALAQGRERAFSRLHRVEAILSDSPDAVEAVRTALGVLNQNSAAPDILGSIAVTTAAWVRLQGGQAPVAPSPERDHAADLLYMALGSEDPALARALDTYLTTVVDHGLNASTFAARVVASTQADDLGATVAALAALQGPLHGGAPGPVLDMLEAIGSPDRAEHWLRTELEAGRRIMGMGHRVYRVRDPRAAVLDKATAILGTQAGRIALAATVERTAARLLAERHPTRPLRANVEFGTAVLLDAIGFPRAAFTAVFACSRAAAWLAHAAEQRRTGRLLRPRLQYIGPALSPPACEPPPAR